MRKTIKISASFTGTISTGQWENSKPFYAVEEVWETDEIIPDLAIQERQMVLHDMCYEQFKRQSELCYQDKIAKTYENIRFYDGVNGIKYPSVTSIIGMDEEFSMSPDELSQYGARGTIIHKQIEIFLKTGEWKEPKNIPEIFPDWLTMANGNLALTLDGYDFRSFYKDYPFKVIDLEKTVLNHDLRYGGRLDIKCLIDSKNPGKWAKEEVLFDVPTICESDPILSHILLLSLHK